MAPETRDTKFYDGRSADVFSLGVIIFIMVTGHHPFLKATKKDKSYLLLFRRQFEEFWSENHGSLFSAELKDLLIQMLDPKPQKRPSMAEIEEHVWMQQEFNHDLTRQIMIEI